MSVSFTLTASPTFPAGATLSVYTARSFPGGQPQPGFVGLGVTAATAVVTPHGFAEVEGLAPETRYFAGASVNGVWAWIGFRTAAEAAVAVSSSVVAAPGATRLGAAMNYEGVVEGKHGPLYTSLFGRYYDRLVCENETKAEKVFNSGTRAKPTAPDFSKFEAMLAVLGESVPVHYHTFIWHEGIPEWLTNPLVAWTETTLREAAKVYIQSSLVAALAAGKIVSIDVLNEVLTSSANELRNTFWVQHFGNSGTISKSNPAIRFYAECFLWCWEIAPTLPLFYNEASLELDSQYEAATSGHEKGLTALRFVEVLKEILAELGCGATIGVGFECHRETGSAGVNYPSTAELARHIREFQALGCLTRVSELDVKVQSAGTRKEQAEAVAAIVAAAELTGSEVFTWGVTNASTFQGGSSFLKAAVTLGSSPEPELESITGWATSGEAVLNPFSTKPQTIKYTGITGKKLTGVTGGTGTIPIGTAVVAVGAAGPRPLFWSADLIPVAQPSWGPLAAASAGAGPVLLFAS